MRTFKMHKKRDGQLFQHVGYIYAKNFAEAQIEFAEKCYEDLLIGVHGDDYVELSVEEDGVSEDGIYYLNGDKYEDLDCFFPKANLIDGIITFNEDVYTWAIGNNIYGDNE